MHVQNPSNAEYTSPIVADGSHCHAFVIGRTSNYPIGTASRLLQERDAFRSFIIHLLNIYHVALCGGEVQVTVHMLFEQSLKETARIIKPARSDSWTYRYNSHGLYSS
jgi:hypothetical protein